MPTRSGRSSGTGASSHSPPPPGTAVRGATTMTGYIGDVSILVGSELTVGNQIFHSVATCPVGPPDKDGGHGPEYGEVLDARTRGRILRRPAEPEGPPSALIPPHGPRSGPTSSSSPRPGVEGEMERVLWQDKISADEETYFAMDDNNDQRVQFRQQQHLGGRIPPGLDKPPAQRDGARRDRPGSPVAQFLAKDNIFWLYEITNTGTTTYNKMVLRDARRTFVGVTSTESGSESSDDWSFYDPTVNITYTGDFKAIHGQPMTNPLWSAGPASSGTRSWRVPEIPMTGSTTTATRIHRPRGSAPRRSSPRISIRSSSPSERESVLINDDFSRSVHTIAGHRHGPSYARTDDEKSGRA